MYFFKVLISTILLKTVLHKGTAQDLQCIHGERNIYSAIWTEYKNVSEEEFGLMFLILFAPRYTYGTSLFKKYFSH